MNDFDSLLKSTKPKRKGANTAISIYRETRQTNKFMSLENLQLLNINKLQERNTRKKINFNLLSLWGMLDMKNFIDALNGNTINPYLLNSRQQIPIKDLDNYTYLSDNQRILNLIDIKYLKTFVLENVTFNNVYLTTSEILDANNIFRPYVTLLTLDDNNQFVEFGYGYDTNNNGKVELFISSFNYVILLNNKGILESPLSGKSVKLKVENILTSEEVSKLSND